MTSYELQCGRQNRGSICAAGDSVQYKAQSPYKGDAVFKTGVWVGKSSWSDCHVVLTPAGAVEAKTSSPTVWTSTSQEVIQGWVS